MTSSVKCTFVFGRFGSHVFVSGLSVANTCTCTDGTATVATGSGGTLCESTGNEDCSACNGGYVMNATAGTGAQTCVGRVHCYELMFLFRTLCPLVALRFNFSISSIT